MDDVLLPTEEYLREEWERRDDEGPEAYQAFALYRDMGVPRSLASVGRKLGKSKILMERWSTRYAWVDRCRLYDSFLDQEQRRINEERRRAMIQRHAALGAMLQSKVITRLSKLYPVDEEGNPIITVDEDGLPQKPEELPLSFATSWLSTGIDIERRAMGEPDVSITHGERTPQTVLPVVAFDYGTALNAIAPSAAPAGGPVRDSEPPGEDPGGGDGTTVGQVNDGVEPDPLSGERGRRLRVDRPDL